MSHNIKTSIVTISAERANELYGKNTNNRNISPANLAQIENSLRRGEWKLNGEAIKIAEDGTVLDGQHRLAACIKTGIPFETLLITGLPLETQVTMDSGKARSPGDVLKLEGFPAPKNLASVIVGVIRAERYGLRAAVAQAASGYPVSRKQVLDRAKQDPHMQDLMRQSTKFNKIGLPGQTAAILMQEFSKIDSEDADFFFDKLLAGDGMERGYPILTLRNQLWAIKTSSKGTRNRAYIAALTIKAWNKFRDGESASLLKFVQGGAKPEAFPEPH